MSAPAFDPRKLNDPVAAATSWTPLQAERRPVAMRLKEHSPARLDFDARGSAWGLLMTALVAATFVLIGLSINYTAGLIAGGVAALIVAWSVPQLWEHRAVFDRDAGAYWIGLKRGRTGPGGNGERLTDIRALQLLTFEAHYRANRATHRFRCYELNLVLADGRRRPVAASPNLDELRQDAQRLQRFLACRFWDTVPPRPPLSPEAAEKLQRFRLAIAVLRIIPIAIVLGFLWHGGVFTMVRDLAQDLLPAGQPGTTLARTAPAPVTSAAVSPAQSAPVAPSAPEVATEPPEPAMTCAGMPVRFLTRCQNLRLGADLCYGKPREALVECFIRNPDPAWLRRCAALPLAERPECLQQFASAQKCGQEPSLDAVSDCMSREQAAVRATRSR